LKLSLAFALFTLGPALGISPPLVALDQALAPAEPAAKLADELAAEPKARHFGAAEGLPGGEIHAFEQTEDRFLWLGGSDGLIRFDGRSFERIDDIRLSASQGEPIKSLARDIDGYLFVGLQHSGLIRFTGHAAFAVSRPASGDWLVSVLEEKADGFLWVAGPDQLWHLGRHGNSVKPALPGVGIRHLFTDPYGATWVAARSGLFRRIGAAFQPVTLPYGRSAADARALALDGMGNLWLAPSGGGLWRLSGNFERGGLPQEITPEPAFEGILVEHAITDRKGRLWLATSNGVFHQTASGLQIVPTITEHCLKIFEDLDGDFWIAARGGGLWQVHTPHEQPEIRPVLALVSTSLAKYLRPPSPLELSAQDTSLHLKLAAPLFEPNSRARFRWQLEGVDGDWQEGAEGIADYPKIPSGRHLFRAQATYGTSFDGEELHAEIIKAKAPWQEPMLWLVTITGLSLVSGLVLHLRRIRRIRRMRFEDEDEDDDEDLELGNE